MCIVTASIDDGVPEATRARWKSLESVSQFGWCGSAMVGGVLADKFGYARTFVVTIALQVGGFRWGGGGGVETHGATTRRRTRSVGMD